MIINFALAAALSCNGIHSHAPADLPIAPRSGYEAHITRIEIPPDGGMPMITWFECKDTTARP